MVNTHIMEVFRNLTLEDLNELRLFISADYNNRSHLKHDVIRLFELLKETSPLYLPEQLDKTLIYHQLYPDASFVKGKLDKAASELNRLIKEFLLQKYYKSTDAAFIRSLHWSKILREFALNERYEQYLARVEKDHLSGSSLSPQYFYHRFLLEYERHYWMGSVNQAKKDINLAVTIESLNVFFEIYRLDLLNRLISQQKVTHFDIPLSVQLNIGSLSEMNVDDANIILKISTEIHHLLKKEQPSQEEFTNLLRLIKEHEDIIDTECLSDYYIYLRNLCTFLINSGMDHMIPVLHQLHRDSLERGYMYMEGKILSSSYGSITKIALMDRNIDWAENFVESHKEKVIGEKDNHEFYFINKALCLFARKEFDAVLDILPDNSDNAMYYLQARRLEVMCHYEMQSGQIINKMEAFKMLVRRASEKFLSPYLRDMNYTFANFLHQIVTTKPGDKNRAARIADRIRAKTPVAESRWLLTIVTERI